MAYRIHQQYYLVASLILLLLSTTSLFYHPILAKSNSNRFPSSSSSTTKTTAAKSTISDKREDDEIGDTATNKVNMKRRTTSNVVRASSSSLDPNSEQQRNKQQQVLLNGNGGAGGGNNNNSTTIMSSSVATPISSLQSQSQQSQSYSHVKRTARQKNNNRIQHGSPLHFLNNIFGGSNGRNRDSRFNINSPLSVIGGGNGGGSSGGGGGAPTHTKPHTPGHHHTYKKSQLQINPGTSFLSEASSGGGGDMIVDQEDQHLLYDVDASEGSNSNFDIESPKQSSNDLPVKHRVLGSARRNLWLRTALGTWITSEWVHRGGESYIL